jgi:hypothetical protein
VENTSSCSRGASFTRLDWCSEDKVRVGGVVMLQLCKDYYDSDRMNVPLVCCRIDNRWLVSFNLLYVLLSSSI